MNMVTVGTCGQCGGRVAVEMHATHPVAACMDCGAVAFGVHGPVIATVAPRAAASPAAPATPFLAAVAADVAAEATAYAAAQAALIAVTPADEPVVAPIAESTVPEPEAVPATPVLGQAPVDSAPVEEPAAVMATFVAEDAPAAEPVPEPEVVRDIDSAAPGAPDLI